jgi:hypothetical protein
MNPLVNPGQAALADSVVARSERNGGQQFRHQSVPDTLQFRIEVSLGDVRSENFWDLVPDTTKLYWGVKYTFYRQASSDSSYDVLMKRYVYDFTTGNLIVTTGVNASPNRHVPVSYALYQNYPNPFNPSTVISFDLPIREDVTLTVYSILGQKVATLVNEALPAGSHEVRFDGSRLSSGVYFFRLATQHGSFTKAMVLAK